MLRCLLDAPARRLRPYYARRVRRGRREARVVPLVTCCARRAARAARARAVPADMRSCASALC